MNRANKNDSWVKDPDGTTLGFTCSYITGCWRRCSYCFAMATAQGRNKPRYLANDRVAVFPNMETSVQDARADPFWPRVWPEWLEPIRRRKKPTGIFLNIMGEWADKRLPPLWILEMLDCIRACPWHRFYLLTHHPEELWKFSPFPANVWVGITATNNAEWLAALKGLAKVKATVMFISVEPLLEDITVYEHDLMGIDWLIVGAATGTHKMLRPTFKKYPGLKGMEYEGRISLQPDIKWVEHIVTCADRYKVPVFLKENLKPLFRSGEPSYWAINNLGFLRQELPKVEAVT